MHIAVLGLGPAGAVLAHRAAVRGWTVDAYDPAATPPLPPQWPGSYGVPLDALPGWARTVIPFGDVARTLRAHTPEPRLLDLGPYAMIDRSAVRSRLAPGVRIHARRISGADAAGLGVDAVVDCRGVVDRPGAVRQVAYGIVVPADAARAAGYTAAEFMDWRPAAGPDPDPVPSFLYVQPVDGGVLLEETVLATRRRTRDLLPLLRARLLARPGLADLDAVRTAEERVHFPMDRRRRPWYLGTDARGVACFGAAGGLTHPATGYSVAAAVATADRMLDLLAAGRLPRRVRWSAAAAWRLRLLGAELIVRADGPVLQRFFDAFFRLPAPLQRGYLGGQHAGRVAAAMLALARYPRRVLPFLRPLPAAVRAALRNQTLKPR
jgi:lycopene beta-cyclase